MGNYIQAVKTQQDEFCRYTASILEDRKISLRAQGGKGRYLQMVVDSIRPQTDAIDIWAQFEVEVSSPGPWKESHYVHLKAGNGKYVGITQSSFPNIYHDSSLIVLDAC